MESIRRDDGELCGHVARCGDRWAALTVFGGVLGEHAGRESAVEQVLSEGLASLADRWTLRNGETGEEQSVCIREASPSEVTLALDFYDMPGTPVVSIGVGDLESGVWSLSR